MSVVSLPIQTPIRATSEIALGFGDYRSRDVSYKQTAYKAVKIFRAILLSTAVFSLAARALVSTLILTGFASWAAVLHSMRMGLLCSLGFNSYWGKRELQRSAPDTQRLSLPDCHSLGAPRVDEFSSGPANAVLVSSDGQETQNWRLDMIRQARQSIEFAAGYSGGAALDRLLDEMESAVQRGVKVKILLTTSPFTKEQKLRLNNLKNSSPNFDYIIGEREFSPFQFRVQNNHAKFLVVDGKYWLLGGNNSEEQYNCRGLGERNVDQRQYSGLAGFVNNSQKRDMDLVGKGKAAETLRLEFYKLFAIWDYKERRPQALQNFYFPLNADAPIAELSLLDNHERLVSGVRMKVLVGDPEAKKNSINKAYEELISSSRTTINIAHMQFSPEGPIWKALKAKGKEGKAIEVITNGFHRQGPKFSFLWAWYNRYHAKLLKKIASNCSIFEFTVNNTLLHKKVMVIDGEKALIGSYNLCKKSDSANHEVAILVDDARISSHVLGVLRQDRAHSVPFTPSRFHFLLHLVAPLGRFLDPII